MEDAHVARTDVTLPSCYLKQKKSSPGENDNGETKEEGDSSSTDDNDATHARVFAVFDGHGGAEVARFCQIHLVPVLTSQPHWKGENEEESNSEENNADKTEDKDDSDDVNNMASSIGKALVESFHALDRLIDDPNSRSEIERWRLERPPPYAHGETNDVYDNPSILSNGAPAPAKEEDGDDKERVALESESDLSTDQLQQRRHTVMDPSEIAGDAAKLHLIDDGSDESDDASEESNTNGVSEEDEKEEEDVSNKDATTLNGTVNTSANLLDAADEDEDEVFEDSLEEHPPTTDDVADELENKCADGVVHDDSDDEKEEQTNEKNENDDGEVDKTSGEEKGTTVLSANDAVSLFQKLLHMNGTDEGDDDEDDEDNNDSTGTEENGESDNVEEQPKEAIIPTKEALLNPPTGIVAPSVSVPTRIQNGRKVSVLCIVHATTFFYPSLAYSLFDSYSPN